MSRLPAVNELSPREMTPGLKETADWILNNPIRSLIELAEYLAPQGVWIEFHTIGYPSLEQE